MFALNNYAGVSRKQPESTFAGVLQLDAYSRGMGGMGIPGDLSSQSRFVKVAFTKLNSISGEEEDESVSQFFHILGSVDQQRGCCEVTEGKYEITIYTSCCNTAKGIYYYTTYDNHQITAVDMHAMMQEGVFTPAFIIGVPVGFVNVEAAKELIIQSEVPHIVNRGRKGGSNVAAAICNALVYGIHY